MISMKLEEVSFLYTFPELFALIRLTSGSGLPFFSGFTDDDFATGLDALERKLLVSRAGETLSLDRTAAFLARTVGVCRRCAGFVADDYYTGAFLSEQAVVFLRLDQRRWVLTPYPGLSGARSAFFDYVHRAPPDSLIWARNRYGERCWPLASGENALDAGRIALDYAQSNSQPGKESEPWKQ